MANNYGEIAFTPAVKQLQEKFGSRKSYARMEKKSYVDGLTENEIAFICERDSFYLATISENGYPYIQHRGGPKGFVKVIDSGQIGFIDFRGNLQYVSAGNIATNNRVSLIMVDYPTRARLKIFARAKVVPLTEDAELNQLLQLKDYSFRPEQIIIFTIDAYDWNCPQHITPRYTLEDIKEAFTAQAEEIAVLKNEIEGLKAKLVLAEGSLKQLPVQRESE